MLTVLALVLAFAFALRRVAFPPANRTMLASRRTDALGAAAA
jgi:flagellar biogenesis protein FliO